MPPPQYEPITKYYFGNIDSLADYRFFIKNSVTNKVFKIKQNASFEVHPNKKDGDANKLEVWAVSKTTKLKTNVITLYIKESFKPLAENTAHYAVILSFDKNKALNADFTMVTPKCYSKKTKQAAPIISLNKPTNSNLFPILSFTSILLLTILYFASKRQQRQQYV
jgi:hypothetical protein